jgi:hypothetical protein
MKAAVRDVVAVVFLRGQLLLLLYLEELPRQFEPVVLLMVSTVVLLAVVLLELSCS